MLIPMYTIFNKNNSKTLNPIQKTLINNLQKKYYLREKHQKLLNNILNTLPRQKLGFSEGTLPTTNISHRYQPSTLSKTKTIKTIDINCVIQRETTIEYCINEFLYLLFSK